MEIGDRELQYAVEQTEVLRSPRHSIDTFGVTQVNYYLVTKPIYGDMVDKEETVVREGKVRAERPRIVTPAYLAKLEGFSENARRYLEMIIRHHGPHVPALLYGYKNEPKDLTIVSDDLPAVVGRLNEKIDREGDSMAAIIKGVDELWDVSLLKFIGELTDSSVKKNIVDLSRKGLLEVDHAGIPREARYRIEELFRAVSRGECDPSEVKKDLDRWDLFPEYEDRFLNLFRRR